MDKKIFLLKVMNLTNALLSVSQIQKLFFLLEKRLPNNEGKYFNFQPYFYGPYDKELTVILDQLVKDCKIDIYVRDGVDYYQINCDENFNDFLDDKKRAFIIKLTKFVKELDFRSLCFAIFSEFPEMKEKSIFK